MVDAHIQISSWVKSYAADLYAYALSRVADKLTAEDIVQNTFLSAVESLHRFENKSTPKTWLFSILKNKIADYYRQKFKEADSAPGNDAADALFDEKGRLKAPCSSIQWRMDEELLDNQEFLRALHQCLEALPKKMSTVVRLKYLDGTDSKTVCEKLEITQVNFWQIMHRAKLLLKTCLENKWFRKESIS